MTHQIEIRVKFRAGHRLMEPYKGKCNNPHGEGYTAILIFENNKLDSNGMVLDFGEVKKHCQWVVDHFFDHSFMFNQADKRGDLVTKFNKEGFKIYLTKGNPTAENIAKELHELVKVKYPELKKVGIVESFDDSIAWYEKSEEKRMPPEDVWVFLNKVKAHLQKNLAENSLIPEFPYTEKTCAVCGRKIKYSEWCTYHYKKRRDFCSQKCFFEFVDKYKEEKNGEEKKER